MKKTFVDASFRLSKVESMSDHYNVGFVLRLFVLNACKIMTAAALLLHSIFGCGLHHASACGMHEHGPHESACAAEHHDSCPDGEQDHDEGEHGHAAGLVAHHVPQIAPACHCEHVPCEGNHGSCHSEVECSFVPPSAPEFSLDSGLVVFVVFRDAHVPSLDDSGTWDNSSRRVSAGCCSSPARCALLCTWQI